MIFKIKIYLFNYSLYITNRDRLVNINHDDYKDNYIINVF